MKRMFKYDIVTEEVELVDFEGVSQTPRSLYLALNGKYKSYEGRRYIYQDDIPLDLQDYPFAILVYINRKYTKRNMKRLPLQKVKFEKWEGLVKEMEGTELYTFMKQYADDSKRGQRIKENQWAIKPLYRKLKIMREQVESEGFDISDTPFNEFLAYVVSRIAQGQNITFVDISRGFTLDNIKFYKAGSAMAGIYKSSAEKNAAIGREKLHKSRAKNVQVDDEGEIPPLPPETIVLDTRKIIDAPVIAIRVRGGKYTRFKSKQECAKHFDTTLFTVEAVIQGKREHFKGYYLMEDE